MPEPFNGNQKVGTSILHAPEQRFIRWAVDLVPLWLGSAQLTLLSIPISVLIIVFGYLAQNDIVWLWGMSFMIICHWITDSLDGAVGRKRNEGLVRWGYYMDHFLDYVFLACILIAYGILLPSAFWPLQFFVLVVFGAFMVNSFLALAAANKFQVSYLGIGPTEIRLIFILINTLLIIFGKTHLAGALPYLLAAAFLGLVVVVYRTQAEVWQMDMEAKEEQKKKSIH